MKKLLKLLTKKNETGFSLIELMIVVVIIGILSTVAVPQYQNFQKKAKQGEAKANLGGLYTTMKTFQAEWNQYYGDFGALGFDMSGTLNYNVGFNSGAAVGPINHPVTKYQAKAATVFRADQLCGAVGKTGTLSAECDLSANASATIPHATAVINNAKGLFAAGARGNIDSNAADFDYWQINQLKALTQPVAADVD